MLAKSNTFPNHPKKEDRWALSLGPPVHCCCSSVQLTVLVVGTTASAMPNPCCQLSRWDQAGLDAALGVG